MRGGLFDRTFTLYFLSFYLDACNLNASYQLFSISFPNAKISFCKKLLLLLCSCGSDRNFGIYLAVHSYLIRLDDDFACMQLINIL